MKKRRYCENCIFKNKDVTVQWCTFFKVKPTALINRRICPKRKTDVL